MSCALITVAVLVSGPPWAAAVAAEQKLMPGETVVVSPAPGDGVVARTPLTVVLPRTTPYPRGSADEQRYLKGFCLGYLDSVNGRFS